MTEDRGLSIFDEEQNEESPTQVIPRVEGDAKASDAANAPKPGAETTGTADPGRLTYLASVCDLLGRGEVIAVGPAPEGGVPAHPRLRHVEGPAHDEATADAVHELVAGRPALVLLGSCTDRETTVQEFTRYRSLVAPGSYVIVERTVVNGHPVWTAFGPGPMEAVKAILTLAGEFVADAGLERYGVTFNPSGYLRRVR